MCIQLILDESHNETKYLFIRWLYEFGKATASAAISYKNYAALNSYFINVVLLLLLLLWLLSWDVSVSVSLSAICCLCMCVTSLAINWSVSGLRERASKSTTFKHDFPGQKTVLIFYFIRIELGTRSKWRPLHKNEYIYRIEICAYIKIASGIGMCARAMLMMVFLVHSLSLLISFQP